MTRSAIVVMIGLALAGCGTWTGGHWEEAAMPPAPDDAGYELWVADPGGEDVGSIETFYEPLDAYGDWYQDETYGWVYWPDDEGYEPYADGYWEPTDVG